MKLLAIIVGQHHWSARMDGKLVEEIEAVLPGAETMTNEEKFKADQIFHLT